MIRHLIKSLAVIGVIAFAAEASAQGTANPVAKGSAIYDSRCAACHNQTDGRAPFRAALATQMPSEIVYTLTKGAMRQQAAGLSPDEINAVAAFVTGKTLDSVPDPNANRCQGSTKPLTLAKGDWPSWGGNFQNTRFAPDFGVSSADLGRLKVKWAFALPGLTGSPIPAGGRLFVTSRMGKVYSLDAATGCTYWSFDAGAAVRNSITIAPLPGNRHGAFFGDQNAVIHALDAETGHELWHLKADDYPSARIVGSVALDQGILYVPITSFDEVFAVDPTYPCCRFRGTVLALDAATGRHIWKAYTIQQEPQKTRVNSAGTQMYGPAGAGIWTALTIDPKRGLLYATTGDSYTDTPIDSSNALVAFNLKTGKLAWASQVLAGDSWIYHCKGERVGNCPSPQGPDADFSSPAGLETLTNGKQILVAGAKSGTLFAFDPDRQGKLLWEINIGEGSPATLIWGPASEGGKVFAGVPGKGLKPGSSGGFFAIEMATGKIAWQTPAPIPACAWGADASCSYGQPGAVTAAPGFAIGGSLDGHVRAYDTKSGAILWDFDGGGHFRAVNGSDAVGGNIDGAAITVAHRMMFVNAGNATLTAPHHGDAVLALSPDGK